MSAKFLALLVLSSLFVLILDLIRREKLTFKYAFGWMAAVLAGLAMVLADRLFERAASLLGFELLSNFVFFCCIGVAVFLGLLLTVFLCQQSQRNECMAKKIAMLEAEIKNTKS